MKGNFPSFIQKTDQERVQNLIKYLDLTSEEEYEVTMKLDGSSCTIYYKDGQVGVCSRNIDLLETKDNSFWVAARKTGIIDALENFGEEIAIQAELMGPGVQGNREGLKELDLYIFDVFSIEKQEYLVPFARNILIQVLEDLAGKPFSRVPFLVNVQLRDFENINEFLDFAEKYKSINEDVWAEGVVFKAYQKTAKVRSFKVISNKFLLGEK